jgi:hypothetical protein
LLFFLKKSDPTLFKNSMAFSSSIIYHVGWPPLLKKHM